MRVQELPEKDLEALKEAHAKEKESDVSLLFTYGWLPVNKMANMMSCESRPKTKAVLNKLVEKHNL